MGEAAFPPNFKTVLSKITCYILPILKKQTLATLPLTRRELDALVNIIGQNDSLDPKFNRESFLYELTALLRAQYKAGVIPFFLPILP